MQLKGKKELEELAVKFCRSRIAEELVGEFMVELADSEDEWDPTYLRYIHNADLNIWKKIGEFVLFLDDDDRPVGFVNPLVEERCKPVSLADDDVANVIRSHTIFSGYRVELVDTVSEKNGVLGVLAAMTRGELGKQLYRFRINPVSKEIISARPAADDGEEHE